MRERKFGLALGAGGNNCVYGAGAAMALEEEYGFVDKVDAIAAPSGGAATIGYFINKQTRYGITVYEEDISGGHFVKLVDYLPSGIDESQIMALLKRCGVPEPEKVLYKRIDLDYLFKVFESVKTFDIAESIRTKIKILIAATDYGRGVTKFFDNHEVGFDLLKVLKASMAIPPFYNNKVELEEGNFVDGAISTPQEECIMELTRHGINSVISVENDDTGLMSTVYAFARSAGDKQLMAAIRQRAAKMKKLREQIHIMRKSGELDLVEISPNQKLPTANLVDEREAFAVAKQMGFADVMNNEEIRRMLV